jgi:hypothetical protein
MLEVGTELSDELIECSLAFRDDPERYMLGNDLSFVLCLSSSFSLHVNCELIF